MDLSQIDTRFLEVDAASAATFIRGLQYLETYFMRVWNGYESKQDVLMLMDVMNQIAKYYYSWLASIVRYTDLYIMTTDFLIYFCRFHVAQFQFMRTNIKTERFRVIQSDFKKALDLYKSEVQKWYSGQFL